MWRQMQRATLALILGVAFGAFVWLGIGLYLGLSGNAADRASIRQVEADLEELKVLARDLTKSRATPGGKDFEDVLAHNSLRRDPYSDKAVFARQGWLLRGHGVLRAAIVFSPGTQSWRATALFTKYKYGSDAVEDARSDRGPS